MTQATARAEGASAMASPGEPVRLGAPVLRGSPAAVADRIRPCVELGCRTVVVRLPAPCERQTRERIGDIRDLLDG